MADETTASETKQATAATRPAAASAGSETPVEPLAQEVGAAKIQLPELKGGASSPGSRQFNLLLDVGVEVAAVVGTRELKLEQVLAIHPGAIIDLDKHAGEPIELYVNGKPIALAEIVVVDGRLGARVVQSLARPEGN
jgi:flagellar motor switch protein FliN/FliY